SNNMTNGSQGTTTMMMKGNIYTTGTMKEMKEATGTMRTTEMNIINQVDRHLYLTSIQILMGTQILESKITGIVHTIRLDPMGGLGDPIDIIKDLPISNTVIKNRG